MSDLRLRLIQAGRLRRLRSQSGVECPHSTNRKTASQGRRRCPHLPKTSKLVLGNDPLSHRVPPGATVLETLQTGKPQLRRLYRARENVLEREPAGRWPGR